MSAGRRVSLVLCDAPGEILGTLPPFTVDDPCWPEVHPVIAVARERFGTEVVAGATRDFVKRHELTLCLHHPSTMSRSTRTLRGRPRMARAVLTKTRREVVLRATSTSHTRDASWAKPGAKWRTCTS
jgi:hypothetical protein